MRQILLIVIIFITACSNQHSEYIITGEAQGTTYTIKYIETSEVANLKSEIDSLLSAIDNSMSTYKPNSLISKVNSGKKVEIDPMFQSVLKRSREINAMTEGAFDPTIGPLIAAWGFNFEDPLKMDSIIVDSLLNICGFNQFSKNNSFLMKIEDNASLNFNAIAQGYSVDLIAQFLSQKDLSNYYVELGGELIVKGLNKENKLWRIGIDNPEGENLERKLSHIIPLENKAMATSGNYRKYYVVDGVKYSHTLNPETGYPVTHNLLSATVIANNCMDADAFGTSFMVMGLEKSKAFLEKHQDLQAVLIYAEGKDVKSFYTENIKNQVIELK